MGFTRHWDVYNKAKWRESFPRLVADAKLIVEAADIDLTSSFIKDIVDLRGFPEKTDVSELDLDVLLHPPPPILDEKRGIISLNGVQTENCETFELTRIFKKEYGVKTNRRPYDVVVCAILIRAKQMLGNDFWILCEEDAGWDRAVGIVSILWPDEAIPASCDDEEHRSSSCDKGSLLDDSWYEGHAATIVPDSITENNDGIGGASSNFTFDPPDAVLTSNWDLVAVSDGDNRFDHIKHWLRSCNRLEEDHRRCHVVSGKQWRHMRLIDIAQSCIVDAPENCTYCALSYVWGHAQQSRLLKENFNELKSHGTFQKPDFQLAKSISDAIYVCKMFGQRYLWVDALCIIQDDPQDKLFQLSRMRDVYGNASLTIVAACGDDADAGLQLNSTATSSDLAVEKRFELAIAECSWNTRGWTFQEQVLSRRALFFTKKGIYFHCCSSIYSDKGSSRIGSAPSAVSRPGSLFHVEVGHQLEAYLSAVQHYSSRQLSVQADAANAMKGILRTFRFAMDNRPNTFYNGLPYCAFDFAFCWRTAEHRPDRRRKEFPSWSWLGWNHEVFFEDELIGAYKQTSVTYGSRMMAYDRMDASDCNYSKMLAFGINDAGHDIMYVFANEVELPISRIFTEEIGYNNALFYLYPPREHRNLNSEAVGVIQLDKDWRAKQPDSLYFMPVFARGQKDNAVLTKLMCLQQHDVLRHERVQIVDCEIPQEMWKTWLGPEDKYRSALWLI